MFVQLEMEMPKLMNRVVLHVPPMIPRLVMELNRCMKDIVSLHSRGGIAESCDVKETALLTTDEKHTHQRYLVSANICYAWTKGIQRMYTELTLLTKRQLIRQHRSAVVLCSAMGTKTIYLNCIIYGQKYTYITQSRFFPKASEAPKEVSCGAGLCCQYNISPFAGHLLHW